MLPKNPFASALVYVLVIVVKSVELSLNQYGFTLSKPSDTGGNFVLLRFHDFPVNQFNFNFLHCLGLIHMLSTNEQYAETFACIY